MKLSDRLQTIADLIEQGETVADVGTDHGFLPIYLWESKKSPRVILADISKGSLQKARDNVYRQDYSPEVLKEHFDFRLGDGIQVLADGEVDTVVLAGMGGLLMCDILAQDMEKTRSVKTFIFQPRNNPGKLRWWLLHNGFVIKEEKLVREGRYICEIICAQVSVDSGGADKQPRNGEGQLDSLSDDQRLEAKKEAEHIKYEISESILMTNGSLAREFAEKKLKKEKDILIQMKKAAIINQERLIQTEERVNYLENLLKNAKDRGI
ncbi:SAM-dependent methyltransferase [Aminipila butyrica]|uniref:SAM-dependent methyltransferase n=1 Tax=Aminipila butyrica TaxID=433296 RepID=A0A858BX55_9FIRM|nr:class I SAM-dependent methyltransferase [Aminipila butyrica]QIB69480.1 SAM-dependent methyltransferase [Aminipila butyrica]